MARWVAFLRGVSPMNLRMDDLRACVEQAGFDDVRTLLSSGNVVFDAGRGAEAGIERKLLAAMGKRLSQPFPVYLRSQDALHAVLAANPFAAFKLPTAAKRVVTFLPAAPSPVPTLPVEKDGARILAVQGREAFTAYVPGKGPVFMQLIDRTFGSEQTTRTWDTVRKCAQA